MKGWRCMKKFLKEFKEFAMRGNVLGLAVGVIIGGGFQGIVTAFIEDLFSPILGLILPGSSLTDFSLTLFGSTIRIGDFISQLIHFILLALVVFLIVKMVNKVMSLGKHPEEAPVTEKVCPFCRSSIAVEATRCPHCTSELFLDEEEEEKEVAEAK